MTIQFPKDERGVEYYDPASIANICKECGLEDGEHLPDCPHFDPEKFGRDLTDVIKALHKSLFGEPK